METINKLSAKKMVISSIIIACIIIFVDKKQVLRAEKESLGVHFLPMTADVPQVLPTDAIYASSNVFVIPEYKLIFFTFPKVACSEWKRMFMRMNGNLKWCQNKKMNAHLPENNQLKTLTDFSPAVATALMTSSAWTKAAIVREPKERVLSAFLDKAVKESLYIQVCCNKLQDEDEKKRCIDNEENFESFLYFVTTYKEECRDVHWEPQVEKIDAKWWPYIDFIGHQNDLLNDSKKLLSSLTSITDMDDGRSAWERYGSSGWGVEKKGCENRTHFFLEENSSNHKIETGKHLREWYTPEAERLVEENWAVEWQQERVRFPRVKLFD